MRQIVLASLLLLGSSPFALEQSRWQRCLPSDVKITDVISIKRSKHGNAAIKLTVKRRLRQLRAHCRNGKLVDSRKREIYFYRLVGCWGNPPMDYLEVLDRQRREIDNLKKRYTVIEMMCNPSDRLIP